MDSLTKTHSGVTRNLAPRALSSRLRPLSQDMASSRKSRADRFGPITLNLIGLFQNVMLCCSPDMDSATNTSTKHLIASATIAAAP
jgi:hypothetical protein